VFEEVVESVSLAVSSAKMHVTNENATISFGFHTIFIVAL